MRVLCYTDTFLPLVGGAETVLDNLARQLTRRGDSVTVLAPRVRGAPPDDDDRPYAVRRYRKPFSKRVGVRLILPRLLAMHRRQRYDVIHCHSAYPPAYVALRTVSSGDVVGPLEYNGGQGNAQDVRFAVVKVLEVREAGAYTFEDLRPQLASQLQQEKQLERILEELRARTYIQIRM